MLNNHARRDSPLILKNPLVNIQIQIFRFISLKVKLQITFICPLEMMCAKENIEDEKRTRLYGKMAHNDCKWTEKIFNCKKFMKMMKVIKLLTLLINV